MSCEMVVPVLFSTGYFPTAFRIAKLIAYTVPSGPITVGVLASPMPLESLIFSYSVFVARSQR